MKEDKKPVVSLPCPLCRGELTGDLSFMTEHIATHHPLDVAETLAELAAQNQEDKITSKIKALLDERKTESDDHYIVQQLKALLSKDNKSNEKL